MRFVLLIFILLNYSCSTLRDRKISSSDEYTNKTQFFKPGFYKLTSDQMPDFIEASKQIIFIHKDNYYNEQSEQIFSGYSGIFNHDGSFYSSLENEIPVHQWTVKINDEEKSGRFEIVTNPSGEYVLQMTQIPGNKKYQFKMDYLGTKLNQNENIKIIAHRGAEYYKPHDKLGLYPANTMGSFERAINSGFDGFELDVRVTADLEMVVSHDDNLKNITNCEGSVRAKRLRDLVKCVVDKTPWIPEFIAKKAILKQNMSSLRDVINSFLSNPDLKYIVLDIKPDGDYESVKAIRKAFRDVNDIDLYKKIIFISHSQNALKKLRKLYPGALYAIEPHTGSEDEPPRKPEEYVPESAGLRPKQHNAISMSIGIAYLKKMSSKRIREFVDLAHKYNYKYIGWTISRENKIERVEEKIPNADFLLTDMDRDSFARIQLQRYLNNSSNEE